MFYHLFEYLNLFFDLYLRFVFWLGRLCFVVFVFKAALVFWPRLRERLLPPKVTTVPWPRGLERRSEPVPLQPCMITYTFPGATSLSAINSSLESICLYIFLVCASIYPSGYVPTNMPNTSSVIFVGRTLGFVNKNIPKTLND